MYSYLKDITIAIVDFIHSHKPKGWHWASTYSMQKSSGVMSKMDLFLDLVDYIFDTDLRLRDVRIDKPKIRCN